MFFGKLFNYLKSLLHDHRIPTRDKVVCLALLILIASPIDLIPDWIPVMGVLDDIVYLAIFFEYVFEVLGDEILLTCYPWSLQSFISLRRFSLLVSRFSPSWIKGWLWKFRPSPFRKN